MTSQDPDKLVMVGLTWPDFVALRAAVRRDDLSGARAARKARAASSPSTCATWFRKADAHKVRADTLRALCERFLDADDVS